MARTSSSADGVERIGDDARRPRPSSSAIDEDLVLLARSEIGRRVASAVEIASASTCVDVRRAPHSAASACAMAPRRRRWPSTSRSIRSPLLALRLEERLEPLDAEPRPRRTRTSPKSLGVTCARHGHLRRRFVHGCADAADTSVASGSAGRASGRRACPAEAGCGRGRGCARPCAGRRSRWRRLASGVSRARRRARRRRGARRHSRGRCGSWAAELVRELRGCVSSRRCLLAEQIRLADVLDQAVRARVVLAAACTSVESLKTK